MDKTERKRKSTLLEMVLVIIQFTVGLLILGFGAFWLYCDIRVFFLR